MGLILKSLFYFSCVVIVSVYSETTTLTNLKYTTNEQTTYKLCNKDLLLDYDSYKKSFEMYMLTYEGISTIVHDAYQALRNSQGLNLTTDAVNDQLLTMTFTLLEKCPDSWEIATVNFKTKLVKEVRLEDDNDDVISNWIFEHYSELHEVSKVIRKSIDDDMFKLVFKTGLGDILITDLYIELSCKCTHETATFTYPEHVTRVTTLPPETTTLPTLTGLPATTNKLCDKDLILERSSYEKNSFLLYMDAGERGWTTPDAYLALRNSDGLNWTMEVHDSHEFFLDFTLIDKCSDKWEISTINFRTKFAKEVQLMIDFNEKANWTFENNLDLHQVSTAIQQTLDKDWFRLVFKADEGELFIADVYIELYCSCTHVTTLPPNTATSPTWTEVTTDKLCDKDLLIDYNSFQKKSFELVTESNVGTLPINASLKLRGSTEVMWTATVAENQLFTLRFTLKDKCSANWKIATVNFKSDRIRQAELKVGDLVLHTWIAMDNFLPSPISSVVGQSIDGDVFKLDFTADQSTLVITDLYMELVCNCFHATATTLINLQYTTNEVTTKILCDKDLLIDYNSLETKSFELVTESSIAGITLDASPALRGSIENKWRTTADENQLFTLRFTLQDKCSENREIATVNFKSARIRQAELKVGDLVLHTWTPINYFLPSPMTTVIGESIEGDVFELVFKAAQGTILVSDLYIALCCNSTHETTLIPKTETLPTSTALLATTSMLCDKDLIVERSSYDKNSFLLYMDARERGWDTPGAYQALKNSYGVNWTMEVHDNHLFPLTFTLLDKCSDKWKISTINFRTKCAFEVQLLIDGNMKESWTFENYTDLHQVSTAIQQTLDDDSFQLVFKADEGELLIADVYIDLYCNCPHETEVPTTQSYMTTESEKCLPTHYINNDTVSNLNVSLVLLNEDREIVGDASPALCHDRWKVPVRSFDEMSLELKILEHCINPRISSLKFTVEGVYSLSLMIDNETIIDKRTIPVGKKTIFEEEGPFKGSHIVLTFHLHKVKYYVYGLEVAVCCEYCPNELVVDYNQSSEKFEIELTYQTNPFQVDDARPALLYGTGLIVYYHISEIFSLMIKILEPCPTAWFFKQFQFGLYWALTFEVRIGSEIITNTTDIVQDWKFFTEKTGYFPGSSFELIVELAPTGHIEMGSVYDVQLVACCADLSTGTTREITTGSNII